MSQDDVEWLCEIADSMAANCARSSVSWALTRVSRVSMRSWKSFCWSSSDLIRESKSPPVLVSGSRIAEALGDAVGAGDAAEQLAHRGGVGGQRVVSFVASNDSLPASASWEIVPAPVVAPVVTPSSESWSTSRCRC